ncbi:MAG: Hsp70 family protein [Proteobacteria bacterium]|nr:Hsp70 family protein [Pseudomonadota bacterium]
MRVGIGIDFGTTNSIAAIFDGERVRLVELEPFEPIMPSATYIDRDLQSQTGQDAIDQYVADNTGRTVEMISEVIGTSSDFAPADSENPSPVETITNKVYGAAVVDSGLQGRLFRGTKRLLGDASVRRLMVFEHAFRLVALITPILRRIRDDLSKLVPGVTYGHLGRPVNFEGRDDFRNKTAETRLAEAYRHAGIVDQVFFPEPIAAAVSFLQQQPQVTGKYLLTVDFGGGTLDFCVLRHTQESFDVIATHGVGLGGDHIDQRLFRELLFPLLGKGETWRRRGMDREIETRFPFEDYEDLLLNWAVTYTLNQNRFTTPVLDRIEQGGAAAIKFGRLRDLIQLNLSYLVFQEIKFFKAELSDNESAVLDIPELDIEVELNRTEFEGMIADLLQKFEDALDQTLESAGLANDDIDIVIRTGGSALIPAVRRILDERFPDRVVEHDPFTSVAAGLAIANWRGLTV